MSTLEAWMPIPSHRDSYEVSDMGRVRRISSGRILSPMTDNKGYLHVHLSGRMRRIHRLVLAAFVGESDMLCRHLDGDPKNNKLSNLRYGTPKENSADRIAHGRHRLNGRLDRTHCRHGHEYTPENTYMHTRAGTPAYRVCRECQRQKSKRNYHKKQEASAQG